MIRLATLLIIASLQTASSRPSGDSARFRYILPEGFDAWVCVDFGVNGAAPLKQDERGVFEIVARNEIVSTSSLPHYAQPPIPTEVLRVIDGQRRRVAVPETQSRDEYDSKSPVSRHCLFFGSADDAHRAGRPPTFAENTNAGKVESEDFEFERGTLCDFRDEPRLCVVARDEEKVDVAKILVSTLRQEAVHTVTTKCGPPFHGIIIRYEGHFSVMTHSRQRGPRSGFGEVQRTQADKGAVAVAYWISTEPGTAAEVAGRFGRDLERLLRQAKSASCSP